MFIIELDMLEVNLHKQLQIQFEKLKQERQELNRLRQVWLELLIVLFVKHYCKGLPYYFFIIMTFLYCPNSSKPFTL